MPYKSKFKLRSLRFCLAISIVLVFFLLACNQGGGGGDDDDGDDTWQIQFWYKDSDGDGYSDGSKLIDISQPENYKSEDNLISIIGDCNDQNRFVNPGAIENCTDYIDDDCDNLLNNDCSAIANVGELCESQTPIPTAPPYAESSVVHPFNISSDSAVHREWNYFFPSHICDLDGQSSEVIFCISEYPEKMDGNCAYTDGTVKDKYRYHMNIDIFEAFSGEVVSQKSIYGSTPTCPTSIVSGHGGGIYGEPVSMMEMYDAVNLYINSKVISVESLPGDIKGLCTSNQSIFVASKVDLGSTATITEFDTVGTVLSQFSVYDAKDITCDGENIWVLRDRDYSIARYDTDGNQIEIIENIYPSPKAIAFDNEKLVLYCGVDSLYYLDNSQNMIKLADTSTLMDVEAMTFHNSRFWVANNNFIQTIDINGDFIERKFYGDIHISGIESYDEHLLLSISDQSSIYVHSLENDHIKRRGYSSNTVMTAYNQDLFFSYKTGLYDNPEYHVKQTDIYGNQIRDIEVDVTSDIKGIAYDGEFLWINTDFLLSKHNLNGDLISIINFPDDPDLNNGTKIRCGQMVYADGSFWAVGGGFSNNDNCIYQIDKEGKLLHQLSSPEKELDGIAFDGQYLWVSKADSNRIYKISMDGESFLSMASPGNAPVALGFIDNKLCVIDDESNELYTWEVDHISF